MSLFVRVRVLNAVTDASIQGVHCVLIQAHVPVLVLPRDDKRHTNVNARGALVMRIEAEDKIADLHLVGTLIVRRALEAGQDRQFGGVTA